MDEVATVTTTQSAMTINDLKVVADSLKKFVVEQKLYTNIQGKNYAHVEAWQFAGASLGVLPIITKLESLPDVEYIRYCAEVKLIDRNQNIVGYGVAICSNSERGREKQDEYVIASMAQTRAIGKAYRNGFGWLMKLAGYEPTPSEEMTSERNSKANEELENVRAKFARK